MTYGTILVYTEDESDLDIALPAAITLAKKRGTHIIGLHLMRTSFPSIYSNSKIDMLAETQRKMADHAQEKANRMGARFQKMIEAEVGILGEWHTCSIAEDRTAEDRMLAMARCCDLTVMAQPHADAPKSYGINTVGRTILQSGRPVLVVPYAGTFKTIGERPFIAWNGSRESARAVHDALPLLADAKLVRLYAVDKADDGDQAGLPNVILATALSYHGVNLITERAVASGSSVANTLMSRLADHGSDILIMGGYGHSRAREYVFGGVTRDVLKSMTVPVLFSH